MQYILIVVDGDGDRHRVNCANLSDVTSWMYKFMSDAFIDGDSDKVRFEIQTTPLKEHNENG